MMPLPCTGHQVAKWVGDLHVWGLSLPRVSRLGVRCKCGATASLVCKSAKNGPLPAKNCKPVAGSARLAHYFSKTGPKNAIWQATATMASAAEKRANLGQVGPKPVGRGRMRAGGGADLKKD